MAGNQTGTTRTGHLDAVLVIVDRFTHAVLLEACSANTTGPEVVDILDRRVYLAYGAYGSVTADGDVRFREGFEAALGERGARLRQTTKQHPAANGAAEKAVGLTMMFLRNFVHANQRNWPSLLPQAELARANRFVQHLGCTPYFLLHGHEFRARATAEFKEQHRDTGTAIAAPFTRAAEMEEQRAAALDQLLAAQERLAELMNQDTFAFEIGTWVMVRSEIVRDPDSRVQDCRKIGHRWSGPFQVKAVRGNNAYEVQLHAQSRANNVINIEHLKPYDGPEPTGPAALPDMGDGDMFLVQEVLAHRIFYGQFYQFLVSWVGWIAPRHNSWLRPSALVSKDFRCTVFEEYVRIHELPAGLLRFPDNDRVTWVEGPGAAPTTTSALPLQVLTTTLHSEHQHAMRRYKGVTSSVRQRVDEMTERCHRG